MASLLSQNEIKQIFRINGLTISTIKFADDFARLFLGIINKPYNLNSKTHKQWLYTKFMGTCGRQHMKSLRDLRISTFDEFCAMLNDSADILNKSMDYPFFSTNISKLRREFSEYKIGDKYIPLEEYDAEEDYLDDEEKGRAFVVYYQYDPSNAALVRVFRINGCTTDKNVLHEMRMHRFDWHLEFGLGYYHSNVCLLSHYRQQKENKNFIFNDEF